MAGTSTRSPAGGEGKDNHEISGTQFIFGIVVDKVLGYEEQREACILQQFVLNS